MATETKPLIDVLGGAQGVTGTSPGTTLAVIGQPYYDVSGYSEISVRVKVVSTPTGTTPTLDVTVQDCPEPSTDDNDWTDLVAFTQKSGTVADQVGSAVKRVPGPGTSDAKTFQRYIRVLAKCGNADNDYAVEVHVDGKG